MKMKPSWLPPRALLNLQGGSHYQKNVKLAYHDNTNLCQVEFHQCLQKHTESIEKNSKPLTNNQQYFVTKLFWPSIRKKLLQWLGTMFAKFEAERGEFVKVLDHLIGQLFKHNSGQFLKQNTFWDFYWILRQIGKIKVPI